MSQSANCDLVHIVFYWRQVIIINKVVQDLCCDQYFIWDRCVQMLVRDLQAKYALIDILLIWTSVYNEVNTKMNIWKTWSICLLICLTIILWGIYITVFCSVLLSWPLKIHSFLSSFLCDKCICFISHLLFNLIPYVFSWCLLSLFICLITFSRCLPVYSLFSAIHFFEDHSKEAHI